MIKHWKVTAVFIVVDQLPDDRMVRKARKALICHQHCFFVSSKQCCGFGPWVRFNKI
jgi:hypothetical protein